MIDKKFSVILGIVLGLSTLPLSIQPSSAQEKDVYYCGSTNGRPVTKMRAGRQDISITEWITTDFGKWTPDVRCQEVSKNFQTAYEAGLDFLTTSKNNGYEIICATKVAGSECIQHLMNVPPGEEADLSLETLENIQNGTTSSILLNTKPIYSEYASYDDGWDGEVRPYLNMSELRRQLEQLEQ